MKLLKNSTRILTVVFSLAALVLFFFKFAAITFNGETANIVGSVLAFGGKATVNGVTYSMAKSTDILFCMILAAVSVITAVLNFTKSKSARYYHLVITLIDAVYMLVIALSAATKYIDTRPLPSVTEVSYTPFVLVTAILLFVSVVASVTFILADDYLMVAASKEKKLTIPKKVVKFLKDYKGEIKKIVWPGPRSVVKNTLIVLAICVIIGVFVWLLDFGLSKLLDLVLNIKA